MQKTHSVHSCQADYGRGKCNHFFSCVRPCCLNMLNNAHAGYINKSVTDRYWTTCLIRRRGIAFIAVDIYATVHSTVSTHKRFWLEEDSCFVKYTFLEGGCQLQVLFSSHFSTNFERFGAYLQHLCWIFRNTPTFSLSDGFQRSYGHVNKDPWFFGPPCVYPLLH